MFVKQSYYLEPEPLGQKAFVLLKTVLAESELQAVCKIVLKDREQLAALDPFGPTMLLSTLYWPDEIRDVGELDLPSQEPDFKPTELEMARQLVAALSGEFDATRYRDEYREALLSVIEAKVAGQPLEVPTQTEAEPSKLTDLMAVLEASVAAARAEARRASATDRGRRRRCGCGASRVGLHCAEGPLRQGQGSGLSDGRIQDRLHRPSPQERLRPTLAALRRSAGPLRPGP